MFGYTVVLVVLAERAACINGDICMLDHTKYQRDALNIIYSSNILLYMFRASSTHLQEDTVVCEQHMVPSLSIES